MVTIEIMARILIKNLRETLKYGSQNIRKNV